MNVVSRKEKKFLLSYIEFKRCSNMFNKILIPDEHNDGENGYVIRTLYFDTLNDNDYNEKEEGIEVRKKIRLRVYNSDKNYAMLEMKQKNGDNQLKRSLKIKKEDAIELINGNYSVLFNYQDQFALECYSVMSINCYVPKTIVQYRRMAYVAKENNIRVTFDYEICANETNFNIFDDNLNLNPVFDKDRVVLEVKYNHFLLSYIKDLLQKVEKSEISVSKYCLARKFTKNYIYI